MTPHVQDLCGSTPGPYEPDAWVNDGSPSHPQWRCLVSDFVTTRDVDQGISCLGCDKPFQLLARWWYVTEDDHYEYGICDDCLAKVRVSAHQVPRELRLKNMYDEHGEHAERWLGPASQPLTGEDATRLVSYIEKPIAPEGHNDYLKQADDVYAELQPRHDTAD